MQAAVWDTYVTRKDGRIMHFDIIAPADVKVTSVIYGYGAEYLETKGEYGRQIVSEECRFCHVESIRPQWEEGIKEKGYYIIEMENCD